MKEFIKYFYNIKVDDYIENKKTYYIKSKEKHYKFIIYNDNPKLLYDIYIILKNNQMCCHDIILNKNKKIITIYNENAYILLKENICIKNNITINDLYNPILISGYRTKINPFEKWRVKNDYYESMLEKIYTQNIELASNFDYFLGLGELSINLLSYINFDNIKTYAQHKRLKYNESVSDFFDPLNIVIDSKVRDISLYIKELFFKINDFSSKLESIIDEANFNNDEAILFLSRMLYPDYYFDICDYIINENMNNDKLEKCIKKNAYYEAFLKKIYQHLEKKYNIPNIEWLNINLH